VLCDWLFIGFEFQELFCSFYWHFWKPITDARLLWDLLEEYSSLAQVSPFSLQGEVSVFIPLCFVQWWPYPSWFICDYTGTFLLFHVATPLNLLQNRTSLLFLHSHLSNRYRTRTIVQIYNSHICFGTINRTGWFRINALDLCLGGARFEFWLSHWISCQGLYHRVVLEVGVNSKTTTHWHESLKTYI
jgi:hypothetical protein